MDGESEPGTSGESKESALKSLWTPQPGPQANAISADWCPCIFYGGGKFSGKSDFLLGDYLQDLETYKEHWQGIIFRRALTEFTELKLRANELFPKIGGKWQDQKSQWIFPDFGTKNQYATLRFRYLERLQDIRLYEGHSYPWIGVDELGDWEDETAFFRLFTFNRYGRYHIPNKRVRATGNPGGRGHLWIKKYFVDPAPLGSKLLYDSEFQQNYMFILGTYRDNKIGMMNDPGYDKRLNRAGSKALVKALKDGDFSVVAGQFFDFGHEHIIHPFPIPKHWTRMMSMDWGACGAGDPFSIGWWAISDGGDEGGKIPKLRRGTRVRYREWYGKGLPRVAVSDVAKGILKREEGDVEPSIRVAGGDIKKKNDASGPSVKEMFSDYGIHFVQADMSRVPGWLRMRDELKTNEEGQTKTVTFSTCTSSIEIIPAVQHSLKDPNDIEESNDDLPDEWRYAHMIREWVTRSPEKEKSLEERFKAPLLEELWAERERQLKGRR